MKLSYVALLGAAAALPLSIYFTYTGGGSLTHDTATVAPTAPAPAEAAALQISPNEEAGALTTMAGSNGRADGMDRDSAALREEMAHLRAEVFALRRQLRAQKQTQAVATGEGEEDPGKNLRTDPVARAEAERRHQEQVAAVEAAFQSEPADPQWSSQTTMVVQEALASSETVQTAVRNIECRSHTCRVEVSDENTGTLAKFMPVFALQMAQTLPSITAHQMEDDNGVTTMILYLSHNADEPPYN